MPEPQLFHLILSDRSGNYVTILLDEAFSEDPEFLVEAIRQMKQRLASEQKAKIAAEIEKSLSWIPPHPRA